MGGDGLVVCLLFNPHIITFLFVDVWVCVVHTHMCVCPFNVCAVWRKDEGELEGGRNTNIAQ